MRSICKRLWREEYLFALKQAMSLYDTYSERLNECHRQLETMLAALQVHKVAISQKKRRTNARTPQV